MFGKKEYIKEESLLMIAMFYAAIAILLIIPIDKGIISKDAVQFFIFFSGAVAGILLILGFRILKRFVLFLKSLRAKK